MIGESPFVLLPWTPYIQGTSLTLRTIYWMLGTIMLRPLLTWVQTKSCKTWSSNHAPCYLPTELNTWVHTKIHTLATVKQYRGSSGNKNRIKAHNFLIKVIHTFLWCFLSLVSHSLSVSPSIYPGTHTHVHIHKGYNSRFHLFQTKLPTEWLINIRFHY